MTCLPNTGIKGIEPPPPARLDLKVAHTGFELLILLPQPPDWWEYEYMPLWPAWAYYTEKKTSEGDSRKSPILEGISNQGLGWWWTHVKRVPDSFLYLCPNLMAGATPYLKALGLWLLLSLPTL